MNRESRVIKLQYGKMDLLASTEDEHKAQPEEKPSYPKRASVVELWRKRESAIKASSSVSKGRTRAFGYEEKKESHPQIDSESEKDARQQDGNPATFVHPTGSDRNGPEPTTDTAVDVGTAKVKPGTINAPKRSNIRDSWKKKATYVPSPQPSPAVGKILEPENPVLDSMKSPHLNTQPENKCIPSTIEKPHTPLSAGSRVNANKASPSSFDELKSKWAKFGVQKESSSEGQSPPSPKISEFASTMKVEQGIADKSEDKSVVKLSPMRHYRRTKVTRDQRSPARTPLVVKTREESTQVRTTKDGQSVNSPVLPKDVTRQNSPSSETRSTFLAARRFRSRYGRRPASTKNCTTDETTGLTKSPSTDLADKNATYASTKNCTTDETTGLTKSPSTDIADKNASSASVPKKECIDYSMPSIEKELVPSFPLDEAMPANSPTVSSNQNIVSMGEDQNNLEATRSSLSSRASQRLRDIRKKTRTKEETGSPTNKSNETTRISPVARESDLEDSKFQDPGRIPFRPSRSLQRNRTNESYASTFVSQDDCSESTYGNSQMNSTHASVFTTDSTVAESKGDEKVPLRDVVLDVEGMIPDEFVSENNTNFESFKTAYDNTTFGQIAKDITEEASVGMNVAMNTIGELFQLNSPKKMIRRAPSPVEEVAIEVEYVPDSD